MENLNRRKGVNEEEIKGEEEATRGNKLEHQKIRRRRRSREFIEKGRRESIGKKLI